MSDQFKKKKYSNNPDYSKKSDRNTDFKKTYSSRDGSDKFEEKKFATFKPSYYKENESSSRNKKSYKENYGDNKKPYDNKSFDANKPYGNKRPYDKVDNNRSFDDKKPFADKRAYDKPKYCRPFDDNKPYSKKSFDTNKPHENRSFDDSKTFDTHKKDRYNKYDKTERSYPDKFDNGKNEDGSFKKYEHRSKNNDYGREKNNYDAPKSRYREEKPISGKRYEGKSDNGPMRFSSDKPRADRFKSGNTRPNRTEPPAYDYKKFNELDRKFHKREDETNPDQGVRLNRYIANAGVCSRRDADELIRTGSISVNGSVVTEMGYQVKPNDTVKYGNKILNRERFVYLLLNKPKDFITTTDDPDERKTVMDLVKNACNERIYPVGRLDRNTTGLLLLTNDGELAEKLAHPSNDIKKIYQVDLNKPITEEDFIKIQNGLELEDGKASVDDLQILSKDSTILGIQIHIGRNRIVRRIFESLGYDVVRLDRVMYAGLDKKDLPRGNWRFLSEKEVIRLKYFI